MKHGTMKLYLNIQRFKIANFLIFVYLHFAQHSPYIEPLLHYTANKLNERFAKQ